MPSTPYSRLLLSIDGGDATAGASEAAAEAAVQFVYESTAGWPATPAPYLEIFEYPLTWTPDPSAGWVQEGDAWRYYGSTPPPAIAAPSLATWGKVKAQLVVGGGKRAGKVSSEMTSEAMVYVRSAEGLESLAWREGQELDELRSWVGAIQRDLRLISTALGAVGALTEAELRAVAATLTASLPVNGKKITGLANGSSAQDAAAFGQIATAVNAAVSGTTNTLSKIVSANTLGDSGITDDGTTVNTTRVVTVTKDAIGTTSTDGVVAKNTTTPGSAQYSPRVRLQAATASQVTSFWFELQPTGARSILSGRYASGASPGAGTEGIKFDSQGSTYGNHELHAGGFISNQYFGFRCAVGGAGVKENSGTGQGNFYSPSTSVGALFDSALAVGDSDPCWDFYASAGTRTAGNFAQIRDGGGTVFAVSSATATRGRVYVNGIPIGWNIVTLSADATVAIGDKVLVQGGGIIPTLPPVPTTVSTRDIDILILEVNGGVLGAPITVTAAAGDLINGSATAIIGVGHGAMQLSHDGDGTNWRIIGSHLL